MYPQSPSGRRGRPPSPHPPHSLQQSLSIRTTPQATQHGTSLSPPRPDSPLPIPSDKHAKTRKLHRTYLLEVELENRKGEPQSSTGYLDVPNPLPAGSVASHTSSTHNRAASIPASTHEGYTDLSSVLSSDGDETLSANIKAEGELISLDGRPVPRTRIRSKLSSVARAKAELMRHLGSCKLCDNQKVTCAIEHHDLDSIYQFTPQGKCPKPDDFSLAISSTSSSPKKEEYFSPSQRGPLNFSQSDALTGIQGDAGLQDLGLISANLDIQSPDSYGDIQLPAPATINHIAPSVATISANPYNHYQNGDMLALGVQNEFYQCQHLELCNEVFNTAEELQSHFALAHFEFTRILPADRFICAACHHLNNDLHIPCSNCRVQGSIQLWIYGQYIRLPTYQRHAPDGQGPQRDIQYSMPSSIPLQSSRWDFDFGAFNGNSNANTLSMPDHNLYGDPINEVYDYNPPSGSDAGDSQYLEGDKLLAASTTARIESRGSLGDEAQHVSKIVPTGKKISIKQEYEPYTESNAAGTLEKESIGDKLEQGATSDPSKKKVASSEEYGSATVSKERDPPYQGSSKARAPQVGMNVSTINEESLEEEHFISEVKESVQEGIVTVSQDRENFGAEYLSAGHTEPGKMNLRILWLRLSLWLMSIYSPPLPSYQRISYICGCGELCYLDVNEISPGGVERFREKLLDDTSAVRSPVPSGSSLNQPAYPAQVHFGSIPGTLHTRTQSSQNFPLSTFQPGNPAVTVCRTQTGVEIPTNDLQYLLLCVNTKNSTVLINIELGSVCNNDEYLFKQIQDAYQRARSQHEWQLTSIIPSFVHKLLCKIVARLLRWSNFPRRLCNILGNIRLQKIAYGDFVQFQLVPIGLEDCPTWFKTNEFPPCAEVDARRYLYKPSPMRDVDVLNIPLQHLLKPGRHTDRFWITTIPKKQREGLTRQPGIDGQQTIGWGIRVNETLNWSFILLLILIILVLISLSIIIFIKVTSDTSSAFSLGAFLVAFFSVFITYQYFSWVDELS